MKNLKKCDYGWVQELNETDGDVGDKCMVPPVQIGLRYRLKDLSREERRKNRDVTHVAPIRFWIP